MNLSSRINSDFIFKIIILVLLTSLIAMFGCFICQLYCKRKSTIKDFESDLSKSVQLDDYEERKENDQMIQYELDNRQPKIQMLILKKESLKSYIILICK